MPTPLWKCNIFGKWFDLLENAVECENSTDNELLKTGDIIEFEDCKEFLLVVSDVCVSPHNNHYKKYTFTPLTKNENNKHYSRSIYSNYELINGIKYTIVKI